MTVPVMKKIVNIKKETNFKYLNLYTLTYQDNQKTYDYYVASRRDEKNLTCVENERSHNKRETEVQLYSFAAPILMSLPERCLADSFLRFFFLLMAVH